MFGCFLMRIFGNKGRTREWIDGNNGTFVLLSGNFPLKGFFFVWRDVGWIKLRWKWSGSKIGTETRLEIQLKIIMDVWLKLSKTKHWIFKNRGMDQRAKMWAFEDA